MDRHEVISFLYHKRWKLSSVLCHDAAMSKRENNVSDVWPRELVRWFEREHRPMPWRSDPSPYKVWISEIMLQQTQVVTVIPYFDRFVTRFPSFAILAAADLQEVLKLWEGLGYYSRARNLHQAARVLVKNHDGNPPPTVAGLRELPGIGAYTAAAIASIAFGEPVPSVDGNVLRVCSRLWGIDTPMRDKALADDVRTRLTPLIRKVNPSHFNQAMMETGALICKPRNPQCGRCLLSRYCVAFKTDRTESLPVVEKAEKVPHYRVGVGVIWKRGRLLIARRAETQMLGGLWEFPGGKQKKGETLEATAAREILEETGLSVRVGAPVVTVKHAYSHFKITMTAFRCEWVSGRARPKASVELKWILPAALVDYPMPRANRRIAEAHSIRSGKSSS
jgi:A/G-specific adenine glycosylase